MLHITNLSNCLFSLKRHFLSIKKAVGFVCYEFVSFYVCYEVFVIFVDCKIKFQPVQLSV
jgi:hypothetical protein